SFSATAVSTSSPRRSIRTPGSPSAPARAAKLPPCRERSERNTLTGAAFARRSYPNSERDPLMSTFSRLLLVPTLSFLLGCGGDPPRPTDAESAEKAKQKILEQHQKEFPAKDKKRGK